MKTLEIIHLRSSGEPLESLARRVRESLVAASKSDVHVTLYRRQGLETDLAVHIHDSVGTTARSSSRIALRLAAELRAYGLVEHALWEESQ